MIQSSNSIHLDSRTVKRFSLLLLIRRTLITINTFQLNSVCAWITHFNYNCFPVIKSTRVESLALRVWLSESGSDSPKLHASLLPARKVRRSRAKRSFGRTTVSFIDGNTKLGAIKKKLNIVRALGYYLQSFYRQTSRSLLERPALPVDKPKQVCVCSTQDT